MYIWGLNTIIAFKNFPSASWEQAAAEMEGGAEAHWQWVGQFLTKFNKHLPFDLVIPPLGIYPREMKINGHIKIKMGKFIAALFIIAPTWKQPKHPSSGEWINKLEHPGNGTGFSNKMKWITVMHQTWMSQKCMMLNEKKPHLKKLHSVCFLSIAF